MRKWLLLIALSSCFTAFSQTFTVGSTCCNYNYVNYSLKQSTNPPVVFSSRDSFPIDIDGDLIPDIVVRNYINIAYPADKSDIKQIYLTSASNVESVFSTCSYSTPVTNTFVLTNASYGSGYNSISNWDTLKTKDLKTAMVYNYFYNWTLPWGIMTCGQQTNPFYVAFRKILPGNDTIYGWMRLNSNFPGNVIDYAYTCGSYTSTPPSSTIQTSPLALQKCDSVLLNAIPPGGVFYGPGVSGNYFKSKNLALGVYTVNYVLPNPTGCNVNASSVTFTINGASITNTQTTLCVGESLTLTATPTGGTFSASFLSGNVFSPSSVGNYLVTYTVATPLGCLLSTSIPLTVNACVGINEIVGQENQFNIFPNPNNGEFEIKGIREEIIFITNELGQLVSTKNLTPENNYSVKLNNLQNGVYFVGNKLYRQKVVVIK